MLSAGVFTLDVQGRIGTSTTAPDHFASGVPFIGVNLATEVDNIAGRDHVHNGMPFSANGRLSCSTGVPTGFTQGPLAMVEVAPDVWQLAVDFINPITHYVAGIPLVASGALAI